MNDCLLRVKPLLDLACGARCGLQQQTGTPAGRQPKPTLSNALRAHLQFSSFLHHDRESDFRSLPSSVFLICNDWTEENVISKVSPASLDRMPQTPLTRTTSLTTLSPAKRARLGDGASFENEMYIMCRMMYSKEFSDLTFSTKGKQFKVHKVIVCAQSHVIAAALRHQFRASITYGRREATKINTL